MLSYPAVSDPDFAIEQLAWYTAVGWSSWLVFSGATEDPQLAAIKGNLRDYKRNLLL